MDNVQYDFLNMLPGYRFFRILMVCISSNRPEVDDIYAEMILTYSEVIQPFRHDALMMPNLLWFFVRIAIEVNTVHSLNHFVFLVYTSFPIQVALLSYPIFDGETGGCSLGKYLFNLRVVSCTQRVSLPDAIDVSPADSPGIIKYVLIRFIH